MTDRYCESELLASPSLRHGLTKIGIAAHSGQDCHPLSQSYPWLGRLKSKSDIALGAIGWGRRIRNELAWTITSCGNFGNVLPAVVRRLRRKMHSPAPIERNWGRRPNSPEQETPAKPAGFCALSTPVSMATRIWLAERQGFELAIRRKATAKWLTREFVVFREASGSLLTDRDSQRAYGATTAATFGQNRQH